MGKIAMHFGEVVLKTSQYDALKSWYSHVLDTRFRKRAQGTSRLE